MLGIIRLFRWANKAMMRAKKPFQRGRHIIFHSIDKLLAIGLGH